MSVPRGTKRGSWATSPDTFDKRKKGRNHIDRLDFSSKAISRDVIKTTGQKPYVLYPLAAGLLGALAAVVLGPAMPFLIPAIGGLSIGAGAWLLNATLRRDKYAGEYLDRLRHLLSDRMKQSINQLEQDLADAGSREGLNQLERLQKKYAAFEMLLQRKLNPEELTYSRYLGMTEQVFLAGLDNLKRLADTNKGVSAIDAVHLKARIADLQARTPLSQTGEDELSALLTRQQLLQRQQERSAQWLSQNESAMTQIDKIMAAVAEMDPSRPHATMDMESAMQELQRLAARAGDYNLDH